MQSEILDPRDCLPHKFVEELSQKGDKNPRKTFAKLLLKGDPSFKKLSLEKNDISLIDNFQKLIFKTEDELLLETVIIPLEKEGCVTLCLSSQVGCVMGCDFCATAKMTKRRNLKTWEIVDQFLHARQIAETQNRRVTGAVFMGMGEPFLNYENVITAAKIFSFPILNAISAKAITISTVGLVQEIQKFTNEKQPYRLSISLGSAIEEKRKVLLPVASRTSLTTLRDTIKNYSGEDRINIAYVCIGGFNVLEEDAKALGELFSEMKIRLDLIDVTDLSGKYLPPSIEEINKFRDYLNIYLKQPVVRRYSGGKDIRASCGTLNGVM